MGVDDHTLFFIQDGEDSYQSALGHKNILQEEGLMQHFKVSHQ